jgi:hypothetical protein
MAAGSLALAVVAVVGIAFIGSQSKIQPFVVVIDQLGSPVAVARPAPVAKADFDKRLMVAQLAAFMKDVRSMLPDAVAQQVTLNRVYAMAGRDVSGFLNDFFKKTRLSPSMDLSRASTFLPSSPKGAKPIKCRGWKQKPSLVRRLWRNTGKRSSRSGLTQSWQKTRKWRSGTHSAFTSSQSPGQKKFCKGSHHEKLPPLSGYSLLGW